MNKIIAISNHKGGVGKTTTVANLGAALAGLGKKVLLIDLDPQANLSQSFGIDTPPHTIYGAMKGIYTASPINIVKNLDIIPANLDLSGAEVELAGEAGREYILKEVLSPFTKLYNYILIDTPPSLSILTINAFTAAKYVIIPLQAQYLALQGLTKLIEVIDKIQKRVNKDLTLLGVVITQYDKRKILNRDVSESIENYFNKKLFSTKIRDNISLAESPAQKLDIFRYSPKSTGAVDYLGLAKELIKK